jgi:hypothetical protein
MIQCCDNREPIFICGSRATAVGHHSRDDVSVCRNCGQFEIVGDSNGEHFCVSFNIWSPEALEAAAKPHKRAMDSERERNPARVAHDEEVEMYRRNPAIFFGDFFGAGNSDLSMEFSKRDDVQTGYWVEVRYKDKDGRGRGVASMRRALAWERLVKAFLSDERDAECKAVSKG